ncbi:hypothetical protein FSP39_013041 [Pinctada imbricata]|uniref:Protein kinase domain-containing protein n=1 Tax=Pinctada imbricata TaxID=66713 RepID=A0AA88YD63_PINIB|nr:hypothetical protein FSP39_013041 [Pinctada imbricata]
MKIINMKSANHRHKELVEREIDVLKQVEAKHHQNIVSFLGSFVQDGDPCVVMELCDITLFKKIRDLKEKNKVMDEGKFIDILQQIVDGVEVLHDMNIIHRDLKTKNIMRGLDRQWKICDFGVAKLIEIADVMTARIGTPYYMCPEVTDGKCYDQKADIWSLGCTCYEMATGRYAFEGETVQDIQKVVRSGKLPETTKIEYSDEMKDLIIKMLSHEGARRPTIKKIKEFLEQNKTRDSKRKKKKKHKRDRDEEEIRSYKAADVVSFIKKLQKDQVSEKEFEKKVSAQIGKDMFYRLYPLMQAMKLLEDARRHTQSRLSQKDKTMGLTFSNLESD